LYTSKVNNFSILFFENLILFCHSDPRVISLSLNGVKERGIISLYLSS